MSVRQTLKHRETSKIVLKNHMFISICIEVAKKKKNKE